MSSNVINTPEAKIAEEVALQFISKKVGRDTQTALRKEVEILLRLSNEIDSNYGVALNNMCNRLDVNSENGYLKFSTIAEEIYNGGDNWGRIIILYAFAAKLAIHCKQTDNEQMIEKIINWLSCFIARKACWIRESGRGWVRKFPHLVYVYFPIGHNDFFLTGHCLAWYSIIISNFKIKLLRALLMKFDSEIIMRSSSAS